MFSGQNVSWREQPSDKNITVGGTIIFPCKINAQNPTEQVLIWNKGTQSLFYNDKRNSGVSTRYQLRGNISEGEYDLEIQSVEESDDSLYSCQVFLFDSVNAKLTVLCK